VVLGPVLFGLCANTFVLPNLPPWVSRQVARVTPVLSGVLVAAICGQVVARNAAAAATAGLPLVLAVGSLHLTGFFFGYGPSPTDPPQISRRRRDL
jgi:predicted Na+-dependent transporter